MGNITSLEQFSIRQLKLMRQKLKKKKKRDPILIAQLNSEIIGKQLIHRIGKNDLAIKKLKSYKEKIPSHIR